MKMKKPTTQDLIRALRPILAAARLRNSTRAAERPRLATERPAPATLAEHFTRRAGRAS
jgi:hypothetical protein